MQLYNIYDNKKIPVPFRLCCQLGKGNLDYEWIVNFSNTILHQKNLLIQQESIPVGFVPPAFLVPGGGLSAQPPRRQTPHPRR